MTSRFSLFYSYDLHGVYPDSNGHLEECDDQIKVAEDKIVKLKENKTVIEAQLKINFYDVIISLNNELFPSASQMTETKSNPKLQDRILALQIKKLGHFVHYCTIVGSKQKHIYRAFLQQCKEQLTQTEFIETLDTIYEELLTLCQTIPFNEVKEDKLTHSISRICPISGLPITDNRKRHLTTSGFAVYEYFYMAYLRKYNQDPFTDKPALPNDTYGFQKNPYCYFWANLGSKLKNNMPAIFSGLLFIEYLTPACGYLIAEGYGDINIIGAITNSNWMHWIWPLQQTMLQHFFAIAISHLIFSCIAILAVGLLINFGLSLHQEYQARTHADAYHGNKTRISDARKQDMDKLTTHKGIQLYNEIIMEHEATRAKKQSAPALTPRTSP